MKYFIIGFMFAGAIIGIIDIVMYNMNNTEDLKKQLKEKTKPIGVTLIRAFKNVGNWDSVYLYSDGHLNIVQNGSLRYFSITYEVDGLNRIGQIYFDASGFPSFKEIRRRINEKKKIIILNIYEFRDKTDYDSFIEEK